MVAFWILLGSMCGGLLAGGIALLVGGVGVTWRQFKFMDALADQVVELKGQVEREVKRRAGAAGPPARADSRLLEELAKRATGVVVPGEEALESRASILRRADRLG